jgi:alkaline phosphatase D
VTAPGRDQVELHPGTGIYRHMRELLVERGTDFMLLLGDQVYSDGLPGLDLRALAADPSVTDERLRETYRLLYRAYFNESGIRALAEALPAYLMWDDHDIFDGWGSLLDFGPAEDRLYRAAESVFVEYQQLRNPGGELAARPPFGYSFWHGDVGFHVADLRGERSFNARRVLGERGWALLDEFLPEASARDVPTVFIGASVPVVHASPMLMRALEGLRIAPGRDVRDRWSVPHFAGERTKLVERLFAWQSARPRRQVVVLSGDVHVAAAFSVRRRGSDGAGGAGGGGRFAQWTSSALSTPDGLAHVVVNKLITRFVRVGERELRVRRRCIVTSNNFGLVEVEPLDGGGHAISFGAHQYHARRDRLVETRLDELRPAAHQTS